MGSVELMLPLAYSEGVLEGRLTLCELAERTAERFGLERSGLERSGLK